MLPTTKPKTERVRRTKKPLPPLEQVSTVCWKVASGSHEGRTYLLAVQRDGSVLCNCYTDFGYPHKWRPGPYQCSHERRLATYLAELANLKQELSIQPC